MDIRSHTIDAPSVYEAHKAVSIGLSKAHLAHNINYFKSLLATPTKTLCAVVKGDGYGHGMHLMVAELINLGIQTFAVSKIEEAKWVRYLAPQSRIILLCDPLPFCLDEVLQLRVEPCLNSLPDCELYLKEYRAFVQNGIQVHIKVDTGMSRLGLSPLQFKIILDKLPELPTTYRIGVMSHFAKSESPQDRATVMQCERFRECVRLAKSKGISTESHISNTSGTLNNLLRDETGLVRIGIGLCGGLAHPSLKPVLAWYTHLQYIQHITRGAGVGYVHMTHVARDSRVGILPVGYRLGYPVALSNVGRVEILGYSAQVLGRVGMDLMAIDLTDIPLADEQLRNQRVCLISNSVDHTGATHVAQLAKLAQTIPYELLCRLHPGIHRAWEDK